MKKHKQWRLGAIAGAAALLGSVVCFPAHALSLGRITVQSTLGEPLRAEIDVAEISPDEASSLKAGLGTPDAFKAAGLEFSPALNDLTVSLQKRPDGRSFLRLRGSRPVNEPFVDLLIQTRTANGSLSRDYAVLIDPPSSRSSNPTAVAPTAPVLSRPATPSATAEATPRESAAKPAAPRAESSPRAKTSATQQPVSGDKQVTVKTGDTAGRIAAQNKPDGVSLDQMLLAMQRGNPAAFIGGNVNRIKAGAVLDLPSADTALAITTAEASQTILTQSRNFNEFRRKFAQNVPNAAVSEADRAAGGKITARVDDRAASGAAPDKLTLSKGSVQAKAGTAEDAIAKKREAGESSARVAELSKNISELNKLGAVPAVAGAAGTGGVAPQGAASAAVAGKAPMISIPLPAPATGATATAPAGASTAAPSAPVTPSAITPPLPATSSAAGSAPVMPATPMTAASAQDKPVVADAPPSGPAVPLAEAPAGAGSTVAPVVPSTSTASAPVRAASAPAAARPAAAPKPEESARFLDDLLENPLVLPLTAGLLALLAGFGIYRYSRRSGAAAVDSSFLESRLQPDSFFGASGGQHIDTNEANATGSSLVYSPSQLDAAGDVDPVAEADVYLAYGRDLQAEEILKEALRTSPTRVAIHSKLCEIYAKRRDAKAFEVIAAEALKLTSGKGTEWAYICELGQEMDPVNAIYRSGSAEIAAAAPTKTPLAPAASAPVTPQPARADLPATSSTRAAPAVKRPVEVDFDLDLDLDIEPTPKAPPRPVAAPVVAAIPVATAAPVTRDLPEFDMDFGPISGNAPLAQIDTTANHAPKNSFNSTEPSKSTSSNVKVAAPPPAAKGADDGMLEFDLDSLSLDLNEPTTQSQVAGEPGDDPLQTKFSLAEEFRSLGDAEGARSLAEEVLSEARGPLKVKAQAFLNALV